MKKEKTTKVIYSKPNGRMGGLTSIPFKFLKEFNEEFVEGFNPMPTKKQIQSWVEKMKENEQK
jgi:hypothetical protein